MMSAEPYELEFDPSVTALVIIDMQRDFVLPGGFGEALGNDVTPLWATIGPIRSRARCGAQRRHARGAHARRPSTGFERLSSEQAQTRARRQAHRRSGPMGRILVRGEIGHDIVPELAPKAGKW
jgi:nicotinamidase-related amidase